MPRNRVIALAVIGLFLGLLALACYRLGALYQLPGLGLGIGLALLAAGVLHLLGIPVFTTVEGYFIYLQEQHNYFENRRRNAEIAAAGGRLPASRPQLPPAQQRRVNMGVTLVLALLAVLAALVLLAFGAIALSTAPVALLVILAVPLSQWLGSAGSGVGGFFRGQRDEIDMQRLLARQGPQRPHWDHTAHQEQGFDAEVESLIYNRSYDAAWSLAAERLDRARRDSHLERSAMYQRYLAKLELIAPNAAAE